MNHQFVGKWITNEDFYNIKSRNVFHKQLDKINFDCNTNINKHILFRKKFTVTKPISNAKIFISADDV